MWIITNKTERKVHYTILNSPVGEGSQESNFSLSNVNRISSQIKLPQLPLPEYSNKGEENLEIFFNQLEGILNRYSLKPYEKFIFLMRQLSGEPLAIVKSLDGNAQNYDDAKELLLKASASPIKQKAYDGKMKKIAYE